MCFCNNTGLVLGGGGCLSESKKRDKPRGTGQEVRQEVGFCSRTKTQSADEAQHVSSIYSASVADGNSRLCPLLMATRAPTL